MNEDGLVICHGCMDYCNEDEGTFNTFGEFYCFVCRLDKRED